MSIQGKSRGFWASVGSVMVGNILSRLVSVLLVVFLIVFVLMLRTCGEESLVKENSFLVIDMTKEWSDNTAVPGDLGLVVNAKAIVGLHDILRLIDSASNDDRIAGIILRVGDCPNGYASIREVRLALERFQEKDKPIFAYGDVVTQRGYYLASVADRFSMNAEGYVLMRGFGAELTYFGELLQSKLKMDIQVFRPDNNAFKSAVEPFVQSQSSPENKAQYREILRGMYGVYAEDVAASRGIETSSLDRAFDGLSLRNPRALLAASLIDTIEPRFVFEEFVLAHAGGDEDGVKEVSLGQYYNEVFSTFDDEEEDHIAIVYAQGSIVDGKGNRDDIGGDKFAEIFHDLRKDDQVKGVVLRINSGGGSALASEVMWQEINALSEVKPLIISIGDVAASGGYYMACGGDYIYSESNAITGSIGVFGIIPNVTAPLGEFLGVYSDTILLHDHATMNGVTQPFSDYERNVIQEGVNSTYELFLNRVADGRNLPVDSVREIAQGRVYTGHQALSIGLIDAMGGLDQAVSHCIEEAELDKGVALKAYPNREIDGLSLLMNAQELEDEVKLVQSIGDYVSSSLPFIIHRDMPQKNIYMMMPVVMDVE